MQPTQRRLANAVRALAMDAVEAANSGHPGMPMGMADAATTLFTRYLKYDPADPKWPDRDRFVLSAGHGSMLIYALAAPDRLCRARRSTTSSASASSAARAPATPRISSCPGSNAPPARSARGWRWRSAWPIAERHLNAIYGDALVDHRTFVIAGDGCLMEGVNHEAAGLAGHLKLGRLIVLWDDNRITIDGSTDLSRNEDVVARHMAMGWHTIECDGMDGNAVARALDAAIADERPSLIRCKTIIGYGAPNKQGTAATHGAALGADEVAAARKELGWTSPPFEIPGRHRRRAGARPGSAARSSAPNGIAGWRRASQRAEFEARIKGEISDDWLKPYLAELIANPPKVATRKSSEMALEAINAAIPATIGGSADLTGSNNTKTKSQQPLTADVLRRPLHLLRHSRVRHGGGDERHGAAWRGGALRRHLPGLHRLCAPRDPPVGAAAGQGHLRHDP